MNDIEKLIKKLCPKGVPVKPLGEIVVSGEKEAITKKDFFPEGKYPVINSARTVLGFFNRYNNTPRTLVLTSHGAYAGFCHFMNERFFAGALCYPMRSNNENELDIKWLFYYLQNIEEEIREKFVNKSGVPYVNISSLMRRSVPVPPMEVQREIVKILDKFTELEAELEARKKQYSFYREQLLSFNDEIGGGYKLLTLGEIGRLYSGLSGKSKKDFQDGNAKFITYKNVYANLAVDFSICETVKISGDEIQTQVEVGDVLFTGSSETPDECGMSAVVTSEPNSPVYLNSFCFGLRFFDRSLFLPHFTKHLFRCQNLRNQISKTANGVTRFNVSKKLFAQISVPVPPMEVQREIVKILDKFDRLVNDLTEGLPAEIEARRAQYAYYREKLLSF